MEQNILLTIKTFQEVAGEEMQMTTEAVMERNEQNILVHYLENLSDEDSAQSVLTMTPGSVMIVREENATNMMFEKNMAHHVVYNTPVGPMNMKIFTTHLETNLESGSISADIAYNLSLNGSNMGTVKINISVKELS